MGGNDTAAVKNRDAVEVFIFFAITYGICWGMGLILHFIPFMQSDMLGTVMMVLPATGVSVAKLYKNFKGDKDRKVHLVYVFYFAWLAVFVLLTAFGVISEETLYAQVNSLGLLIGSVAVLFLAWFNGGELDPFKNVKKAVPVLLIYTLVRLSEIMIIAVKSGRDWATGMMGLPQIFMFFFLQCLLFYGEEYGWRGFLQEKMQNKFGKRAGVIALGFIWELWHMPLWFSTYNLDAAGVLLRLISTPSSAVIIGYAYMKTRNAWVCAVMHYINNSFTLLLLPSEGDAGTFEVDSGILAISVRLVCAAVFFAFLFTKEYKKTESHIGEEAR